LPTLYHIQITADWLI